MRLFSQIDAAWVWWAGFGSAVMFVGSLVVVRWILISIPADHFLRPPLRHNHHNRLWWLWLLRHFAKNVAGIIIIAMGLVMLAGPGQGVLTILIGVSLLDFPGKRTLELKLIRRPRIHASINWLREQAGKPPLLVHPPHPDSPAQHDPSTPKGL